VDVVYWLEVYLTIYTGQFELHFIYRVGNNESVYLTGILWRFTYVAQ